jgi:hypothetical protein
MVVPITLSASLGAVLVYLSIYSKRNHGIGPDNGSSSILFGWRFTPTLVAVLYAQMTVILFEDVKRTEPFTRLASAPAGGAGAYGTILQTPRAWWAIFIDACFRRKRIGKTSWSLICAAFVNVVALLAISPLSSALLASEEVLVTKSIDFNTMMPRANTQLRMAPTRETYFRTMTALMRNISTSAWLTDTTLTFPFWPISDAAQLGPNLASSYAAWKVNTTSLKSEYDCQNMTLESADLTNKRYSNVYTSQLYGPLNGTQPMITFVLNSGSGCRYELSMHPAVDLAFYGGMTWSNATTFYPVLGPNTIFPMGGRIYTANVTSTHVFARLNASEQCNGRDIIIMSKPWTTFFHNDFQTTPGGAFVPKNMTYTKSPTFEMKAITCKSRYFVSKQSVNVQTSSSLGTISKAGINIDQGFTEISDTFVDIPSIQAVSMQNDWRFYFDPASTDTDALRAINSGEAPGSKMKYAPGLSGMAPLLGSVSSFNLSSMMRDPGISDRAGSVKGRFFMETLKEAFNNATLVETDQTQGEATIMEERVVVLTEIGFTLAALFFASSGLLIIVFWQSRLTHRPLNLRSDPSSIVGISLLLNHRLSRTTTLQSMHSASQVDLYTTLQKEKYLTSDSVLVRANQNTGESRLWFDRLNVLLTIDIDTPIKVKAKRNWRPRVIHVRTLFALGLLLTILLVALLILNALSGRSQLSQLAWIYQANVSQLHLSFSTFAPISIAPTVVSIIVGLWWDQLDTAFRILQPFITLSEGPTPMSKGAGLTYRSKSWIGAAFKAGRNRHWVLFMIAIGSVLAQVLTVSMSALFEQNPHNVVQQTSIASSLEIRQVPLITEVDLPVTERAPDDRPALSVLEDMYLDASKNWLYGAGIQHAFNESQLPWTSGGWNFLPVDLSQIPSSPGSDSFNGTNTDSTPLYSANVTLSVPGIRARLECSRIEETVNASSWMQRVKFPHEDEVLPEDFSTINKTRDRKLYQLPVDIFANTSSHTTMFSDSNQLDCCANGTLTNPQRSIIGYWSPVLPYNWTENKDSIPWLDLQWPPKLAFKWIVGKPVYIRDENGDPHLWFQDIPQIQAVRCQPVIETTQATVMLDKGSGFVHTFDIDSVASMGHVPWTDVFTRHQPASGIHFNNSYSGTLNITTSFGVLFLDSLLGAADRSGGGHAQNLANNAFIFRDPKNGINMDLMAYSMYTLANKDPEALLNYTTLVTNADRTFQTFFQYFVNSEVSLTKGGYAYQPISDNSLKALGRPIDQYGAFIEDHTFPVLSPNRTVTATVSHRIRVLNMNAIATYLSAAILIWLIFTTVVVAFLQRKYTSSMIRDVELIADMLVLVAGSDNFLQLVQERGVALKGDAELKTMLGWFKDRNGEVRWGVEVVGGNNAVEWVDAPKHGWHVQPNTSSVATVLSWRRPWKRP